MSDITQKTKGPRLELNSQSLAFAEEMFARYAADPNAVSPDWRDYFAALSNGAPAAPTNAEVKTPRAKSDATLKTDEPGADADARPDVATAPVSAPPPSVPPAAPLSTKPETTNGRDGQPASSEHTSAAKQERIDQLIRNYRVRGHICADLDPLDRPRPNPPELDPSFYGFTDADYVREFVTRSERGVKKRTLHEILWWLRNTYCRTIGVQFMHIDDLVVREWLQNRMEETENHIRLSRQEQLRILERLTAASVFESFLETKFTGAKSFSLAGAESLIPLLDLAIEQAGADGVQEIVLAMAHRGRLNVLANVIGKAPREIFREFQDLESPGRTGPGDVKYHLGYSSDWTTASGRKVHLSLSFNPSHLEYVNPVAMGRMRAKQDRFGDKQRSRGLVILIHGDAAFAGEGVVQECLNLSQLPGYQVGGTLHVVLNNQIGFTTNPEEGRSSAYSTDVAKMLQIPIFHVNGEDPEAVAQTVRLGLEFRKEFHRDVVIDMYAYRLRGHNEGDEPSYTQPLLYKTIAKQRSVRDGYLHRLLALKGVTKEEAAKIEADARARLDYEYEAARSKDYQLSNQTPTGIWSEYHGGPVSEAEDVDTGISSERVKSLLMAQTRLPEDFTLHRKLTRAMDRRREMAEGKRPLDWSAAEAVAMASLADDGYRVRISGQDTERGTFSQRHAVLHDYKDGRKYMPLANISPDQAPVEIINSPLSENAVLGFEYGYSLDWPDGLIGWEAQFGDFVNAAQVVVDQFIASAETKWRRLSGVVLLLPHGFEGQGPEHSSARLERFLALCAEDNMQVVYPTTPAQYFHCLRRQVLRKWRKPLIVMTPKSLLRHRECESPLEEFEKGRFQTVMEDPEIDAKNTDRIILCSGKVYFDLIERRRRLEGPKPALIRLEQLYPLPVEELRGAFAKFTDAKEVMWVQEEPENMGAWRYMRVNWNDYFREISLSCVSRPCSASPATGSKTAHDREQKQLIERALGAE